mgnify:CR=1 FL=1
MCRTTDLPLKDDGIAAVLSETAWPSTQRTTHTGAHSHNPFSKRITDTRECKVLVELEGRHRSLQAAQTALLGLGYRAMRKWAPVDIETGAADHGVQVEIVCDGIVVAKGVWARTRLQSFVQLGGVEMHRGTTERAIELVWLSEAESYALTEQSREVAP